MGHVGELSLLFVCFVASAAFGEQVIKPVSEADLDALVRAQIKGRVKRSTCEVSCPYGWVKLDNRCFTYFANVVDWITAEAQCLNLGANLVSIHSETEYQMVKALIRAYDPSERAPWIGLSGCQKVNNWIWSDGTKYDFTRWNANEPNNAGGGECCVHISSKRDWNDYSCGATSPFICVKRL